MAHLLKTTTTLAIHIRKKKKKVIIAVVLYMYLAFFSHHSLVKCIIQLETVTSSNTGAFYNKFVNYSS